jgi:hypothetical protein
MLAEPRSLDRTFLAFLITNTGILPDGVRLQSSLSIAILHKRCGSGLVIIPSFTSSTFQFLNLLFPTGHAFNTSYNLPIADSVLVYDNSSLYSTLILHNEMTWEQQRAVERRDCHSRYSSFCVLDLTDLLRSMFRENICERWSLYRGRNCMICKVYKYLRYRNRSARSMTSTRNYVCYTHRRIPKLQLDTVRLIRLRTSHCFQGPRFHKSRLQRRHDLARIGR